MGFSSLEHVFIKEQIQLAETDGVKKAGRLEGYWEGKRLSNDLQGASTLNAMRKIVDTIMQQKDGDAKLQKLIRWLKDDQIVALSSLVDERILRGALVHARNKHTQHAIVEAMKGEAFATFLAPMNDNERADRIIKNFTPKQLPQIVAFFNFLPVQDWVGMFYHLPLGKAKPILDALFDKRNERQFFSNLGKISGALPTLSEEIRERLIAVLPKDAAIMHKLVQGACRQVASCTAQIPVLHSIIKTQPVERLVQLFLVKNKAGKCALDLLPKDAARNVAWQIALRQVEPLLTRQLDEIKLKLLRARGLQVKAKAGLYNWEKELASIESDPKKRQTISLQLNKIDSMLSKIQKQHVTTLKYKLKNASATDVGHLFLKEIQVRIAHENEQYEKFFNREKEIREFLKAGKDRSRKDLYPGVEPAFMGSTSAELYADFGVCLGASFEYAAQQIQGKSSTIQPTKRARQLEAGHTLEKRLPQFLIALMNISRKTDELNRSEKLTQHQIAECQLAIASELVLILGKDGLHFKNKMVQLKEKLSKLTDSTLEQMRGKLEVLYSIVVQGKRNTMAAACRDIINKDIAQKKMREATFQEIKDFMVTLLKRCQSKSMMEDAFLQSLQVQAKQIALEPKQTVEDFTTELESILKRLNLPEGGHTILCLFDNKPQDVQQVPAKAEESDIAKMLYQELCTLGGIQPKPTAFDAIVVLSKAEQTALTARFLKEKMALLVKERAQMRVGKDAPPNILQLIEDKIENEVKEILKTFAPSLTPTTSEFVTGFVTGHAIYVRFKAGDYEIQDVNYPGFTAFRTKDLNELKMYLGVWFALHHYTHVEKVISVSPRNKKL